MDTTASDNFYLLLELFLDPPEENWAKVEARINEKKNEWNKKRNNPDGLIYQRLSERVEDMRAALGDVERRKSEGAAARDKMLRELDEQIASRSGETIAPEQVDALVKEFKAFFAETTVRSRVKVPICDAAPIRRVPDPPKKPEDDPAIPSFSSSKLREVKVCLQALGKNTIYDVWGLARTSTLKQLNEAAEEACRKARAISVKTAEISALGTLGGLAKEFFKDEKSKRGFDASWANFQFEEKLKPVFNGRIVQTKENGKDVKFVTKDNYERSLREATEAGMTLEAAEWFVYDHYVNKRKCPDPRVCDAAQLFAEKVNCPNCFRQNDKSASRCVECGCALQTKCPKCGVNNALSEFCSNCGFSFGDMANSDFALQQAKEALARRNFDAASLEWNKAKVYWPENPDLSIVAKQLRDVFAQRQYERLEAALAAERLDEALNLRQTLSFDGGTSPLVEELKRCADERLQREKDYLDFLQKIDALQRREEFFTAERLIANAPSNMALRSKLVEKKEELARAIEKIRRELNDATRESDLTLKERKIHALTLRYPDFEEAEKALGSLPPLPPDRLQTRSAAKGIEIAWRPSPSLGAFLYRVERWPNHGGESEKASRAVVVCEATRECSFDDVSAEEFECYVYKVTARRKLGARSPEAQSEPALRVGEIRDVEITSESKKLRIKWEISPRVDGIVVYRKDLTRLNEARVLVESVGVAGFIDDGLENERAYEYEACLRYRDVNGALQTTSPQRFTGTPCEKLAPVDDLKVSCSNNRFTLTWTAPKKGDVCFWILPKASGFSCGETFCGSQDELCGKLGQNPVVCRIEQRDEQGRTLGTVARKFNGSERCVVLPATTDGVKFTFGREREIYAATQATNIVAQVADDGVYFSWDWPANAVAALVLENSVEPPREENYAKCRRYRVSKAEYDRECAWKRSISSAASYYFKVFMIYCVDGKERLSQGVNFRNRRDYIEYCKVEPRKGKGGLAGLFSKRKTPDETLLQITATDGNTYIPEICVVRQWYRPPLRRDDGDVVVDSLGPSNDGKLELRLNDYFEPNAFYRCYLKNREDAANFALLDPSDEHLRLHDATKPTK
jgi:hypothetical protein